MHVGFALLTLFPGRAGGSETNVRGLLEQFTRGNGPERVTVLANRHVKAAYGEYESGPVNVRRVASYHSGKGNLTRSLGMLRAFAAPRMAARDVPKDIEVLHHPVTVPIPRLPVPTVTTLLDLLHVDLPEVVSPPERAFRRAAYERAAKRADVVITISEHSRERLIDHTGIPPERIEVVPLGIDRDRFSPEPGEGDERLRERLDLPERYLVYPANLWPHKNHKRLIEALEVSAERDLSLVFSGSTQGRMDDVMKQAHASGLADRVHHVGYVAHDELPALLRNAVAMVFPSLYEGFGAPPLEAMASGCPVACSDRGSLPETSDDAALHFNPESVLSIAAAIDRICSDEVLRRRLRAAGLARVERYTWEAAASRHLAVYERAAEIGAGR